MADSPPPSVGIKKGKEEWDEEEEASLNSSSDEDDEDFDVDNEAGLRAMSQSEQEEDDLLDEEFDAEEELRQLEQERREEERRALGGWDDESAIAYEEERAQVATQNASSKVSAVVLAWPNVVPDDQEQTDNNIVKDGSLRAADDDPKIVKCGWLAKAPHPSDKDRTKERKGRTRLSHVIMLRLNVGRRKATCGTSTNAMPLASLSPAVDSDMAPKIDWVGTVNGIVHVAPPSPSALSPRKTTAFWIFMPPSP